MNNIKKTRRNFIKKSTLATGAVGLGMVGFSAKSYGRILGANDRVSIAQIGCKRRAVAMKGAYEVAKDKIDMSYVCDIYLPQMDKYGEAINKTLGYTPKKEKDIRKVLEDKDVDAIINATPDHWHAPGTWMALEAGKHVYVEKPCSHNPREGELLVAYQNKYNDKVVQMGNQQRSALESQQIIKDIHNGIIGEAYMGVAFYSNSRPALYNTKAVPVPKGFDWELFQGPAPRGEYLDAFFDYNWHWYWQFGTGETGNNSVHEIDIARWALQVEFPNEVSVLADKFQYKDDDWQMYDTMDATFKFNNDKVIKWDGKSRNNLRTYGAGRGTLIYGTEGSVFVDRNGYKLYNRGGELQKDVKAGSISSTTGLGGGGNATNLHFNNFIESIKGKEKPNAPIDEGAVSTLYGHLANISYRTKSTLKCNPTNGHILKNKAAMKLWDREYEKGWEPNI